MIYTNRNAHNDHNNIQAIADSGCTAHVAEPGTFSIEKTTTDPISVTIPDGSTMILAHKVSLNIPQLSNKANKVHIVQQLSIQPLPSVSQMYDDGCQANRNNSIKSEREILFRDQQYYGSWRTLPIDLWQSRC